MDAKTVREYYQILVDTLSAVRLEPFKRRQGRQVITSAPKFYLFDVGVAGILTKRRLEEKRAHGKIQVFPWRVFLNELWGGRIV